MLQPSLRPRRAGVTVVQMFRDGRGAQEFGAPYEVRREAERHAAAVFPGETEDSARMPPPVPDRRRGNSVLSVGCAAEPGASYHHVNAGSGAVIQKGELSAGGGSGMVGNRYLAEWPSPKSISTMLWLR